MANFWRYYNRFGKQFLRECGHSWRAEVSSSVLAAVAGYLITKGSDQKASANLKTALLSAGIVLAAFAIAHIFRIPVMLDEERRKKEEDLTSEASKLADRLEPRLRILTNVTHQPVGPVCSTYYVDVVNESGGTTITGVKVS